MKKVFVEIYLLLLITGTISAQNNIERYSGTMRLPEEVKILCGSDLNLGEGFYDYYLNNASKRVKHGNFFFKSNEIIYNKIYEIEGNFSHGKKSGQWIIRRFNTTNKSYDDDKYYLSLTFDNDSLEGPYKIIDKDGAVASLISSAFSCNGAELEYKSEKGAIKNNKIDPKNWQYKDLITLDNNGLPHGVFKIAKNNSSGIPFEHERYYHHGNLIYICNTDQSTGEIEFIYKFKEDVQRPIRSGVFTDTIINGQQLISYRGVFYQSKQSVRDNYSMDSRWSPITLVPRTIKNIMPSICSGWDNTLVQTTRNENNIQEKDDCVFSVVDQEPEFIGGTEALYKYLANNLKYPTLAEENGITGKVYITFIVNTDGTISNVSILKDIGGGCGQEAKRVVENMPKWKPGKQNGKYVRVKYSIPVIFDLK